MPCILQSFSSQELRGAELFMPGKKEAEQHISFQYRQRAFTIAASSQT